MQYNQPYGGIANAGYINGDPSVGRAGSIPPAAAIEYPQREIVEVITDAGLTPANGDLAQLAKAIQTSKLVYAGVDSGTADAMVGTLLPVLAVYQAGMMFAITKGATTNATTTPTINFGPGVKNLRRRDGTSLAAGDLLPNMSLLVEYDGANFRVLTAVTSDYRSVVPFGNPILYVRTDGNDSHDGSANDAAHAFLTIQAAINYSSQVWSLGGKKLIIQLGNAGTYVGFVNVITPVSNVEIIGNDGAPGSYVISPPAGSASQVVYAGGATLFLHGVTVTTTRLDINLVEASYAGSITLGHVIISVTGVTAFYAMVAVSSGAIDINGPVTINGFFGAGCYANAGSITLETGTTLTCTATFSNAAIYSAASGTFLRQGTFAGSVSGPMYFVILNGTVQLGGATFSGASAGSTASGGQVA